MHFSPFLFQLRFQWPRSVITTSTRLFCCCLLWYHQKLIKHDRRIVMQEIIDTEKIAVNESSVFHQPFPPPYHVTYFSKGSYVHECFGYFQNNRSLDIWYHWSFIFLAETTPLYVSPLFISSWSSEIWTKHRLREKCPNTDFFLVSAFGHFSRSAAS